MNRFTATTLTLLALSGTSAAWAEHVRRTAVPFGTSPPCKRQTKQRQDPQHGS